MKHQNVYNRLRRIEGQIRGIEEMVAKDRSDQDILIQLEAAKSSLSSTIAALIESMMEKDPKGSVVLDEEKIKTILRFIRQ
ncbi:MAG: metal-sensing transcriptional repressor [Patescibacteria group bacterium]